MSRLLKFAGDLLLFQVIWLLFTQTAAYAEAPTTDFIVAALSYQNTATVDCTYTIELSNFPLFSEVVNSTEGRIEPPPASQTKWQARYIRTPEMLYKKLSGKEHSSERSGVTDLIDYRQKEYRDDKQLGSIRTFRTKDPWRAMDKIETLLFPVYPRTDDPSTYFLYGWIKYGKVADTKEQIEGADCWRLDIIDTGDSDAKQYELWLDPAIGFCPRRVSIKGTNTSLGDFSVVVDSKNYRSIGDGIWFPTEQTVTVNAVKRKMVNSRTLLNSIELHGDKKYTKSDLQLTFDPGATVYLHTAEGVSNKIVQP